MEARTLELSKKLDSVKDPVLEIGFSGRLASRELYYLETELASSQRSYYNSVLDDLDQFSDEIQRLWELVGSLKGDYVLNVDGVAVEDIIKGAGNSVGKQRKRRLKSAVANRRLAVHPWVMPQDVPEGEGRADWGEFELCFGSSIERAVSDFLLVHREERYVSFSKKILGLVKEILRDRFEAVLTLGQQKAICEIVYRTVCYEIYRTDPMFWPKREHPMIHAEVPLRSLEIPDGLRPSGDLDSNARECFLASKYCSASRILDTLDFQVDSLSVLGQFERFMAAVHAKLGGGVVAFDDMFSVLLGSFLASSVTTLASTALAVGLLLPADLLSQEIEDTRPYFAAIVSEALPGWDAGSL